MDFQKKLNRYSGLIATFFVVFCIVLFVYAIDLSVRSERFNAHENIALRELSNISSDTQALSFLLTKINYLIYSKVQGRADNAVVEEINSRKEELSNLIFVTEENLARYQNKVTDNGRSYNIEAADLFQDGIIFVKEAKSFLGHLGGTKQSQTYPQRYLVVIGLLDEFQSQVQVDLRQELETVSQSYSKMQTMLGGAISALSLLSFISVIIILSFSRKFSHTVADPIRKLSNAARRIGEGDVDVTIDVEGYGEVKDLALSMQAMVSKLTILSRRNREATQKLWENTRSANLLKGIALGVDEAEQTNSIIQVCLDAICTYLGWPVGHAYILDEENNNTLVSAGVWHFDQCDPNQKFQFLTRKKTLRYGEGLAGCVLESSQPRWIEDITINDNCPSYDELVRLGMRCGFAFPVLLGEKVVCVIEFYGPEPQTTNSSMVALSSQIGNYLGRAIERRQTEINLHVSRERLHGILGAAAEAVVSIDDKLNISLFNRAAELCFGCTAEEVLGQSVETLCPDRFCDLYKRRLRAFQVSEETDWSAARHRMVYGRRTDGSIFPAELSMSRVEQDGQQIITLMFHDISQRVIAQNSLRESRDLLNTTFTNFPGGICVLDRDLRIIAANTQYYDLTDAIPEQFPIGCNVEEIIRHRAALGWFGEGDVEDVVRERVDALRRFEASEYEIEVSGGRFLEIQSFPLPKGGLVRTYSDATRRKRAETELVKAMESAELANRSKSEFLANMSHELRTPLNAVIGFSELLKTETLGPLGHEKYKEYTGHILSSGQHLLAVIGDILDLSKVEAGQAELFEEVIHVPKALDAALVFVKERAMEGGVTFDVSHQTDVSHYLYADGRKLKQIALNLLSNAVKFTPEKGTIRMRSWCDPQEGYCIQIADTGIGMAPEDIPIALRSFGQIDGSLQREFDGTGLGLPLTKAFVELHGGRLEIESALGKGTTVTICFPPGRVVAAKPASGKSQS